MSSWYTRISFDRSILSYSKVQHLVGAVIRNRRYQLSRAHGRYKYVNVGCGPFPLEGFCNIDWGWRPVCTASISPKAFRSRMPVSRASSPNIAWLLGMQSAKRLCQRPPNVKTVIAAAAQAGMDVVISRDGSMKLTARAQSSTPEASSDNPWDEDLAHHDAS
jgi:hypothetical protein